MNAHTKVIGEELSREIAEVAIGYSEAENNNSGLSRPKCRSET